ncbi:MAG: sulfatase-like hydrolase/transferase [Thermogutta sp.]|nr:sulfatase-like hydrolase/transferase [Thermogutta sp.]
MTRLTRQTGFLVTTPKDRIPFNRQERIGTGARCTREYVLHSCCSPARAGVMPRRYQQRFGHETDPRYDAQDPVAGLPTWEITIANFLSAVGCVADTVGKWYFGERRTLRLNILN